MTRRNVVDLILSFLIALATGSILWVNLFQPWLILRSGEVTVPDRPVALQGAARLGDPNANVALIEYSDFQCPFCAKFAQETLPEIKAEFIETGKVLLVFRNFPLDGIHEHASAAAEAAACAARKQAFWAAHDLFFAEPIRRRADVADRLRDVLSADELDACTDTSKQVASDVAEGKALGIHSTPTFLIGRILKGDEVAVTHVLNGAKPAGEFRRALESAASR